MKFYKTKKQILHLKQKIKKLKIKYQKTKINKNIPYQQNLQNQIITLKKIIFNYYNYIYLKTNKIIKIQKKKFNINNTKLIKNKLIPKIHNLHTNSSKFLKNNKNQPIKTNKN